MTLSELLHYLRLGGVTMAVLLSASLLALAVAIERLIALWGVSDRSRALGEAVTRHLLRGDIAAARAAAERSEAPIADMYLAGFSRLDRKGQNGLEAAVQRERLQIALKLKTRMWVLGTIGATTPFVGLFGTVAGIMRSFKDLGLDVQGGNPGGPATVMTGISEALIATAVGILVAVMAVVFYNYFQARLARVNVEMSLLADEFVEILKDGGTPLVASTASNVAPDVSGRTAEGTA
ncbi:MAG: MotA/TolQ/ExbB proton channel family protein [Myxococcaceae bacterium]